MGFYRFPEGLVCGVGKSSFAYATRCCVYENFLIKKIKFAKF